MATYIIKMMCEGGGQETMAIEADDHREAVEIAKRETEEWARDGDWGEDGAWVDAWWSLFDADDEDLLEPAEEGSVSVEIEPDHTAKIEKACGGQWDARFERCCGTDPDDHDWTSEGEGGCDQNPGVWSTGGTSMAFADHCRVCGLHRDEHHTGCQRNPGEHDTVEYTMPYDWCEECQSEECSCEHAEAE